MVQEYPEIDGTYPELLNDYPAEEDLPQVLTTRGIYNLSGNLYVTIKPNYDGVENELNMDSVEWDVISGSTKDCSDEEHGCFETVDEAVEFVKNKYL